MKLGKNNTWILFKEAMITEVNLLFMSKTYKLILKELPIGQLVNCKKFI